MEDQARIRASSEPRHPHRITDQVRLHVRLHAPTHHLAAVQVNHSRQIQPAFVRGSVGDVASPDSIGLIGREVSIL